MKEFLGTFVGLLVFCYIVAFFFAPLILENIWVMVALIAFVLSVFITLFMKQESRIEELEKKMEKFSKDN